jgi:hypothetical protein
MPPEVQIDRLSKTPANTARRNDDATDSLAPRAKANKATDHQTRTRQQAQVKRKVAEAGLTDRIAVHIENFKVRTASDSHAAQRDRALQAVATGERAAAHRLPAEVISSKIAEFKLMKAGDCPAAQRARAKRDAGQHAASPHKGARSTRSIICSMQHT